MGVYKVAMNTKELLLELKKKNVLSIAYSIAGLTSPPHDEQYVLTKKDGSWVIYFDERGERTLEEYYLSEDEACKAFLAIILSDHSAIKKQGF